MTYESQVVWPFGARKKGSGKTEPYYSEEHWHIGLAADRWGIEELGDNVWLTSLYICKREGMPHRIEMGQEVGTEGVWGGISPEYCYLTITGTYMGG